jgi:hypothetical protein
MQGQSLNEQYEHELATLVPKLRPEPRVSAPDRPIGFTGDQFPSKRPSVGRRIVSAFVRFCIALLIGVGATLAWQSHGDEAKGIISAWFPTLGRLLSASTAAQDTTIPRSAPATQIPAPAAAVTSSEIIQQLEPMARDIAGARRSLEQLADMTRDLADTRRSLEQLAARQEQIAQSIATLQTFEQDIEQRLPIPTQSRPVPLPPRKPPQPAAQSSTVQTSSVRPAPRSTEQPLPLH